MRQTESGAEVTVYPSETSGAGEKEPENTIGLEFLMKA
jgi:hypothetical protein